MKAFSVIMVVVAILGTPFDFDPQPPDPRPTNVTLAEGFSLDWSPVTVAFDCDHNICELGDPYCLGTDHKILSGGGDPNTDDPAHTCKTDGKDCGPPPNGHGCEAEEEEQEALFAQASAAELALLTQVFQGNVVLNPNRQAIQVFGCDGGVVVHVPLSAETFEAVAAITD